MDIVWIERKILEAISENGKKKKNKNSIITLQRIITCMRGYQKKKKTLIKRRFSSPEPKTQVSSSDHNFSVVISSSKPTKVNSKHLWVKGNQLYLNKRATSGRLGVRIPAATDLSRKNR